MSPNDRKAIVIAALNHLDSEILEQDLEFVMLRYQWHRSPFMARTVLNYIEALCEHPHFHGGDEQRCAYRRLAAHWRHLAGYQRLGRREESQVSAQ